MSEPRQYIKIGGKWYLTVEAPTTSYGDPAIILAWSPSHPDIDNRIIKAPEITGV